MDKKVILKLKKMGACKDAIEWAKSYPTKQAAWDACERADYMLWLLGKLVKVQESPQHKKLVLVVCDCASTALKYTGKYRKVALSALRFARAWAKGKATIEQVKTAADAAAYAASASAAAAADAAYAVSDAAAYAASYAAADAAAYAASYADAAYAADAASASASAAAAADAAYDAAAYTASYAASAAADAAAYAASYAAADAAASAQRRLVKIVRKHYPKAPIF